MKLCNKEYFYKNIKSILKSFWITKYVNKSNYEKAVFYVSPD